MAPGPEESPADPVHSGLPAVQRAGNEDHVPARWLEQEHLDQAEHLDRLVADFNLVTGLAWQGFEGPDYDYFANELAKYGMAVIGGWLRRGLIFSRCRDRGFGGLPEPPPGAFDDRDVVDELTNETVAKALKHFRSSVLVPGKWDYRRGASLRTYFVGQCLIRFANVYRRWWKTESRPPLVADDHTLEVLDRRRMPDVEESVIDQAQVDGALRAVLDPRVRKALVLHAAGHSQAEIGRRLGVTAKAVERMLANERARMRRRGIA